MSFNDLKNGITNAKLPDIYISAPGVIHDAGKHIKKYGKKLLIIGSSTALSKTKEILKEVFDKEGLQYEFEEFSGYPTEKQFQHYADRAKEIRADVLVGVGGGRVLDTTKAAGDILSLPVVSIPTIAATCAAWAAVTIVYNDQGAVTGARNNAHTPRAIIADTSIILDAPARYIHAGIIDTLAKWYETAPNLSYAPDDITLQVKSSVAEIAYKTLTTDFEEALSDIEAHKVTEKTQTIVDAIIYLAGLVGSLNGVNFYGGAAHTFYNEVTSISETRDYLHGERVSFGLLLQFVLEKWSREKYEAELPFFAKLKQPLRLKDIGITEHIDRSVKTLGDKIASGLDFAWFLPEKYTPEQVTAAILEADRIGTEFLEAYT